MTRTGPGKFTASFTSLVELVSGNIPGLRPAVPRTSHETRSTDPQLGKPLALRFPIEENCSFMETILAWGCSSLSTLT
jgi:hypothetical protein